MWAYLNKLLAFTCWANFGCAKVPSDKIKSLRILSDSETLPCVFGPPLHRRVVSPARVPGGLPLVAFGA